MCKIIKAKLDRAKPVKFLIGSKVFWDENKFTDEQIVHLIKKFGMKAMTIISSNGKTVHFKCNNGIIEKTYSFNLKQV